MNKQELMAIARKIVKYVDNGDPAKDATETTNYSQEEVLYELAKRFANAR